MHPSFAMHTKLRQKTYKGKSDTDAVEIGLEGLSAAAAEKIERDLLYNARRIEGYRR